MVNKEMEDWSQESDLEIEGLIQKEKSKSKITIVSVGCLGLVFLIPLIIVLNLKNIVIYLYHLLIDFLNLLLGSII